jgi:hypothetical protein
MNITLTFCTHAQAQADVQHLWFGRRASTRIRSELMAAIYDKALKRKDFSGIVDKDKVDEAKERKKSAAGSYTSPPLPRLHLVSVSGSSG